MSVKNPTKQEQFYTRFKKSKYKSTRKQMKDLKGKSRWVDRAYEDDKATLDLGKGKKATHLMGYGGDKEHGYSVYPNVREQKDGSLRKLDDSKKTKTGERSWESAKAASENNDALHFKSGRKAAKASVYGYKKHGNFDKETVKGAKEQWKEERKRKEWKQYSNGVNKVSMRGKDRETRKANRTAKRKSYAAKEAAYDEFERNTPNRERDQDAKMHKMKKEKYDKIEADYASKKSKGTKGVGKGKGGSCPNPNKSYQGKKRSFGRTKQGGPKINANSSGKAKYPQGRSESVEKLPDDLLNINTLGKKPTKAAKGLACITGGGGGKGGSCPNPNKQYGGKKTKKLKKPKGNDGGGGNGGDPDPIPEAGSNAKFRSRSMDSKGGTRNLHNSKVKMRVDSGMSPEKAERKVTRAEDKIAARKKKKRQQSAAETNPSKFATGSKGVSVSVSRRNSDKIPLGKNKNMHVTTSRVKKKRLGAG